MWRPDKIYYGYNTFSQICQNCFPCWTFMYTVYDYTVEEVDVAQYIRVLAIAKLFVLCPFSWCALLKCSPSWVWHQWVLDICPLPGDIMQLRARPIWMINLWLLYQIFGQTYFKVEIIYLAGRSSQNEPKNMFFGQELEEIQLFFNDCIWPDTLLEPENMSGWTYHQYLSSCCINHYLEIQS